MDFNPEDPLDQDAITLLQAFLILKPNIDVNVAFPILRDYLADTARWPDLWSPDGMTQVVGMILENAVEGKEARVTH